MTLDLKRTSESKRKLRRGLAARPIGEKLAMLDALCERAVTIGRARQPAEVHEAPGDYGARLKAYQPTPLTRAQAQALHDENRGDR